MTDPQQDEYPRPDFVREGLTWRSLDGPWDFLFDDGDVGVKDHWHKTGVPASVDITARQSSTDQTEAESITQKIIGDAGKILKGNAFTGTGATQANEKRKINVPYVYQTPASGIDEHGAHEVLWYERTISDLRTDDHRQRDYRVLLCFGAVDYEATVWVNGQLVGEHQGGHVPFDLDITDALTTSSEDSRLTVRVFDSTYDLTQPRGKQYWGAKPESIFYTPSSGIWQNVWMESVPLTRIRNSSDGTLLVSNDVEKGELYAEIGIEGRSGATELQVEITTSFAGVTVSSHTTDLTKDSDVANIRLPMQLSPEQIATLPPSLQSTSDPNSFSNNLFLWSPAHPHLYDIAIRLLTPTSSDPLDTIQTYTGLRSLKWHSTSSQFLLNSRPLFQRLCLDQGYWRDTGMTPPSQSALKDDILAAQRMGFNGCRKHQKIEHPAFLYHADRLGYLVWGEMANAYKFSPEYCQRFDGEWAATVKRDRNHPCVVVWTPVNESWGYTDLGGDVAQREHLGQVVRNTKGLDATRPVNDNCGWEHVADDLTTFHDYADGEGLEGTCSTLEGVLGDKAGRNVFVGEIEGKDEGAKHREGAPVLCTEMGGVNVKGGAGEHWGYTTASDAEDLLKRVEKLVLGAVKGGVICGFVWTQLTDIEQEANGLYDIDRKPKLDVARVKAIMDEAERLYFEKLQGS